MSFSDPVGLSACFESLFACISYKKRKQNPNNTNKNTIFPKNKNYANNEYYY